MRTVTFADPEIVDFLNQSFVPVWLNHSPDIYPGIAPADQPQVVYSEAEMAAYPEGGGGGNIRSFFCSPEGRILHNTQGYWSPELYLRELQQAALYTSAPGDAEREQLLAAEIAQLEASAAALQSQYPEEMRKPVRESPVRRQIAALELLRDNYRDQSGRNGGEVAAEVRALIEENAMHGIII